MREIREEVILCGNPSLSIIGFINDDANDVGSVHLGIASVVQLPSPILAVREKDKMMGSWIELSRAPTLEPLETVSYTHLIYGTRFAKPTACLLYTSLYVHIFNVEIF